MFHYSLNLEYHLIFVAVRRMEIVTLRHSRRAALARTGLVPAGNVDRFARPLTAGVRAVVRKPARTWDTVRLC